MLKPINPYTLLRNLYKRVRGDKLLKIVIKNSKDEESNQPVFISVGDKCRFSFVGSKSEVVISFVDKKTLEFRTYPDVVPKSSDMILGIPREQFNNIVNKFLNRTTHQKDYLMSEL